MQSPVSLMDVSCRTLAPHVFLVWDSFNETLLLYSVLLYPPKPRQHPCITCQRSCSYPKLSVFEVKREVWLIVLSNAAICSIRLISLWFHEICMWCQQALSGALASGGWSLTQRRHSNYAPFQIGSLCLQPFTLQHKPGTALQLKSFKLWSQHTAITKVCSGDSN